MLAIVMEILRHITNLKPLLDHFMKNRADADSAQQTAISHLSTALRNDLGQLNEASASLNTQLQNQSLLLTSLAEDLRRTRASFESAQMRADATELQLGRLTRQLKIAAIIFALLLLVLTALVAQLLHTR